MKEKGRMRKMRKLRELRKVRKRKPEIKSEKFRKISKEIEQKTWFLLDFRSTGDRGRLCDGRLSGGRVAPRQLSPVGLLLRVSPPRGEWRHEAARRRRDFFAVQRLQQRTCLHHAFAVSAAVEWRGTCFFNVDGSKTCLKLKNAVFFKPLSYDSH